jgi:hypothetical protein
MEVEVGAKKKSSSCLQLKDCTQFTWSLRIAVSNQTHVASTTVTWAGLLAPGSSYSPRLPISLKRDSGEFAAFVPDNSGGTAPDLHGIPF